ncbi:MAG: polysaccharide deacetylase family protein [Clostridia bacterium]|nr:polysaccharide deacetylase family protein [Clostridia bacterium]
MYLFTLSRKKIFRGTLVIVMFALIIVSLMQTGAQSVFFGYASKELPIYYVKTEERKIAISFDCAWGVDYTDKLLSIMESEDVKCTFFTVEFWAKKYPEYLKKIAEHGHEIGTHSATHPHMSKLSSDAMIKELTTSKDVIEEITGKTVKLFRPPYGEYNDLLIQTATKLGLYVIQWDVDSLDWKNLSATEITDRVLSRVKSGSIVLFHNQGLNTAKALPSIIKGLKNKGYTFVPIGELIYKDNFKMGVDGAQIKNS